jgi:iron complex outermembrane receptor protein
MGKIYKYCFLLMIVSLFSVMSFAQSKTGNITGRVRTSDGVVAEAVEISIKGVANTTADRKGNYTLKNVAAGSYTVTARLVGLTPSSSEVTVVAGTTVNLDLMLQASNQQLQEVVISQGKRNKYFAKESDFVSKMPLKNLENPQVYAVITKELMADQIVTNFDDALKNAPGLDKLWSSTGRAADGAGYYTLRGFAVQPTLVNGLPGLTNGSLDVSNVERIEVLKGPSGTLFGSSLISYGGLINTVTKQPFEHTAVEVGYTAGSYGLNRITADVNTSLDSAHKILFRMNAAYHDESSFQDAGFRKSRFFAPSLAYQLNDRVSFLFNAQFLASEGTNPTMLFFSRSAPLKSTTVGALGYNNRKSFTTNDLSMKNPVTTVQAQMNILLSDEWRSQTLVSRGSTKSDGYYSYLFESNLTTPGPNNTVIPVSGSGVFGRYITDQNATTESTDIQQNFIGDFKIGNIRNRVVAGLDYLNVTSINNSSNYALVGSVDPLVNAAENLSKQRVDAAIGVAGYGGSTRTSREVYSAYVSDVINLTPALSAMASIRVDRFQNSGLSTPAASKYGQTAFSPKFGLVYQLLPEQLSVFGNYMNGFKNVAPLNANVNGANTIVNFDPEHANQIEGGIKSDLFDGKLSGSLSYYDIKVSNIVLTLAPNQYSQGGDQYSRGFEAQITANPIDGLNIIAGYAKNKSRLTNAGANVEGRRPLGAGPEDLANLWIGYKIQAGTVKGLGFGFGGNYYGKNIIVNDAVVGQFILPSYYIFNASAYYGTGQFTFGIKLNNLTDKEYYKGWSTLEPMQPRNVAGNISYRF